MSTSFIPVYPDSSDPDIQQQLFHLFELYQYSRSIPQKDRPRYTLESSPFEHQEIFKRLIREYRRMMVIHKTGSGKTCSIVKAAEAMLDASDGLYPKRVIVLLSSRMTIADYKHQIAYVCTQGKYATATMHKRQVNALIASRYTVKSYTSFIEDLHGNRDAMIREYSDCMFVLEEIHNIRNKNVVHLDEQTEYIRLHDLIHAVSNATVVAVSATPMINGTEELPLIMNLLLPLDKQLPERKDYNLVTRSMLEPYLRGIVSYVPSVQNEVIVHDMGAPIQSTVTVTAPIDDGSGRWNVPMKTEQVAMNSTSRLWTLELRGLQREIYLEERKRIGKAFYSGQLENRAPTYISLMVFPSGVWSDSKNKELIKYVDIPMVDTYRPKESFLADLRQNLWQYSAKYYFIMETETGPLPSVTVDNKTVTLPGRSCGFIISSLVSGTGEISLAMCLEAWGFERYTTGLSAFVDSSQPEQGYPGRDLRIKKKLRYILLDKDAGSRVDGYRELINSPENMYGEYVQVVIGTDVTREGINLYNFLRAYRTVQGWHYAGEHQFFSRILRAVSHKALTHDIKQRLLRAGARIFEVDKYKLEVQKYKLVASVDGESLETEKYIKYTETKKFHTSRLLEIMRDLSVDKYLVGVDAMNQRPLEPSELEYSSLGVYDFQRPRDEILDALKDIYIHHSEGYTIADAMKLLNGRVSKYLLRSNLVKGTIEYIIKSEKLMIDASGSEVYSKYSGSTIIPVRGWVRSSYVDRMAVWYNRNIGTCQRTTNSALYKLYDTDLGQWINAEITSKPLRSYLIRSAVELIYGVHPRSDSDALVSWAHVFIGRNLDRYVFRVPEPVYNINETSKILAAPQHGRGRKATKDSEARMKDVKLVDVVHPDAQPIYLDISMILGISIKPTDDVMIFKNKRWRSLEFYEILAYNHEVAKRQNRVIDDIPVGTLYAVDRDDKVLLIVKGDDADVKDKRLMNRGTSCLSKKKIELVEIWYTLGIQRGPKDKKPESMSREQLCSQILGVLDSKGLLLKF